MTMKRRFLRLHEAPSGAAMCGEACPKETGRSAAAVRAPYAAGRVQSAAGELMPVEEAVGKTGAHEPLTHWARRRVQGRKFKAGRRISMAKHHRLQQMGRFMSL